jgi:hypothetical protein
MVLPFERLWGGGHALEVLGPLDGVVVVDGAQEVLLVLVVEALHEGP